MRWGRHGRLNLISALAWGKEERTLHFELAEESVKSAHVIAFIDELARNATGDQLTVVVLGPSGARTQRNNARFHISTQVSTQVKEKRPLWEGRGVFLRYLPPYAPHLNPIEALWKHLKNFLLPRRCYDAVAQLKQAVLEALHLLGAIRVNSNVGEA